MEAKKSFRNRVLPFFSTFILLFASGCGPKTVLVAIPPKIDLQSYNAIGIVDFTSDPADKLSQFATQKFISVVQESQPNARFLELGPMDQLLKAVGRDRFDLETARILGKKYKPYNVDAIFTGSYEISNLQPQLRLGEDLSSVSASATITISLSVKHWDTKTGATLWTNSRVGKWPVAKIRGGVGESISLRVTDPRDRYGPLMEQLINVIADDFRPRYLRRAVNQQ